MRTPLRQLAPLWPYVRPHLTRFGAGCAALVLASGFQLTAPMVLRNAIDAIPRLTAASQLLPYAALFVGLGCLQALCKYASRKTFLGGARCVEHDVRAGYFSHLIRLPPARLETGRKGDFVSRATNDLQDIRLFLGAGILNFFQTLVLLFAATALLWRIHPLLTLAALLPFPAISVIVRKYSPRLHRRYLDANRKAGDLSALVQEALTGARVVRAYQRQEWQRERFAASNRAQRDAQVRVVQAWALLFPLVGVIASTGHIVVLGYGGYLVSQGQLSLGNFVAFNVYLAMLTWPMVALGWTLGLVQRGAAAMTRLHDVLAWPTAVDGTVPLPPATRHCIEARAVEYTREGAGRPTLAGADLAIPEGAFCGLVGATAAGKSTLVSLLARLLRPNSGAVLIHGTALEQVVNGALRHHLAVVPQGDFLFADSVAANVCLGRDRDDERLRWALQLAGLKEDVERMDRGLDSAVGEGGITLSGGQRQRLALARALYGRPETLVLDSALSNLDAATANQVLRNLRRELPGMTLLVVSHRGSEVDAADRVFFLRQGRVAATGSHTELLATVPEYLQLYREEELRRELEERAG